MIPKEIRLVETVSGKYFIQHSVTPIGLSSNNFWVNAYGPFDTEVSAKANYIILKNRQNDNKVKRVVEPKGMEP